MSAIDRIKEWMDGYIQQREKEYGSAFHKDEKSIEEFYNFLSSLAAERCVWDIEVDVGCRTACDNYCCYCPDTDWIYCPYCGKRIEVKED